MKTIVRIYSDLIVNGYKTIEQVPEKIREEVADFLGLNEVEEKE